MTYLAEEIDLPDFSDAAVAILTVSGDTDSLVKFGPAIHSIVDRDVIFLFGLICALHLDCPKQLSYKFIKKIIMGLEDLKRLPPRLLLSLKNKWLMMDE
ncbi:hypothetical protein AALO_G00154840 [Alosa alosa]|uniref:Uncharacterized protein n=1 Tax=Alosa alosa TaxID=278164 RepID=A0AAV6GG05_9TELE|nr:hypothetical protein AALO_G00154840 [Alosa alosa]